MVENVGNTSRDFRKRSMKHLFIGLAILIIANLLASKLHFRLDLTEEKRYTLSAATIQMLKQLDDYAYFKVYLEGDFPAGFKKLRNETRDMLEEFKAYSHYIEYTFINPTAIANNQKRNALIEELVEKGLQPTDLHVNKKDGSSRVLIFPGIILSYKGNEIPIELLNNQMGISPERVINHSIENLEFNLASAIQKLIADKKPTVAFLSGHGEMENIYLADIFQSLSNDYLFGNLRLDGRMSSLFEIDSVKNQVAGKPLVDVILIAQPIYPFSEADKFIIDQYIMHGGKVFWLVDPVFASMDSLYKSTRTFGVKNELNIEDQLFRYGVRLNSELLLDLNARSIPIVTGRIGNQPQQELLPWYYFPLLIPQSKHPIVRNLNSIMTEFPSTLDTVEAEKIKKTVLLQSSNYSKLNPTPAIIDLALIEEQPNASYFNSPSKPVVVLLEGEFKSLYANRIPPQLKDKYLYPYKKSISEKTSMIVSADGDIIKNQLHYNQHYPLPLGFDQFTKQNFGNKEFITNALNFLSQQNGLIHIRSREIKLRMLDKSRIERDLILIQLSNVIAPLFLVFLFGIFVRFIRRSRYIQK